MQTVRISSRASRRRLSRGSNHPHKCALKSYQSSKGKHHFTPSTNLDRTSEIKIDKFTPHIAFTDVVASQTNHPQPKMRSTRALKASIPLDARREKNYVAPENAPAYAQIHERGDGYKVVVHKKPKMEQINSENVEWFKKIVE